MSSTGEEGAEKIGDGLGPVYNAQACRECHQNPITGGASQVTELARRRRGADGRFENPVLRLESGRRSTAARSINDRAICPEAQMQAPDNGDDPHAAPLDQRARRRLRRGGRRPDARSTSRSSSARRRAGGSGQVINVPIVESKSGETRVGRFGWKNQHASLVSFSADAYLNEMGITSELQTRRGRRRLRYRRRPTAQQPDRAGDRRRHALRPLHARDEGAAARREARRHRRRERGEQLFAQIGCAICHVPTLQTAPDRHQADDRPPSAERSATRHSTRSATSCSTTWAPATAS